MPKFAALKQPESLAKMAYEAIRKSILSGQWKIGELYNEKAIAAELGISRTPVREALLELAAQDLVLFLPRRGLMVNRFTRRDVDEIFELRKAIELAAVEKDYEAINAYTFEVDGGMRIEEANEEMELGLPEDDDYETVAGFILHLLGRIPEPNEQLRYKGLKIIITEMRGVKIEKVMVTKEGYAASPDQVQPG